MKPLLLGLQLLPRCIDEKKERPVAAKAAEAAAAGLGGGGDGGGEPVVTVLRLREARNKSSKMPSFFYRGGVRVRVTLFGSEQS